MIVGTGGAIYAAACLGRSSSIFPQARRLVVSGPYRYLRHPLYLAEMTATAGAMLQFATPWSLAIAFASFIAQFPACIMMSKCSPKPIPTIRIMPPALGG